MPPILDYWRPFEAGDRVTGLAGRVGMTKKDASALSGRRSASKQLVGKRSPFRCGTSRDAGGGEAFTGLSTLRGPSMGSSTNVRVPRREARSSRRCCRVDSGSTSPRRRHRYPGRTRAGRHGRRSQSPPPTCRRRRHCDLIAIEVDDFVAVEFGERAREGVSAAARPPILLFEGLMLERVDIGGIEDLGLTPDAVGGLA